MEPLLCDACGCLATDVLAGTRVCESLVCRAELLAEVSEPANGQQTPEELDPRLIALDRFRDAYDALNEADDERRVPGSMRLCDVLLKAREACELLEAECKDAGLIYAPCDRCKELCSRWIGGLPLCGPACEAEVEAEVEAAERHEATVDPRRQAFELAEACSRG